MYQETQKFLGIFTRKLERTVIQTARKHGVNSKKIAKTQQNQKEKAQAQA